MIEALGGGEYRVALHRGGRRPARRADRSRREAPAAAVHRARADRGRRERYQTVYSQSLGSVAAPTAGLHFTPELLADARGAGRRSAARSPSTSAPGTFLPIRDDDLAGHKMHPERYFVPPRGRGGGEPGARRGAPGGRGRARPWCARSSPRPTPRPGSSGRARATPRSSSTPGFAFRQVDALVTNFHLPKSTLLMLVSAFAGRERDPRRLRRGGARAATGSSPTATRC